MVQRFESYLTKENVGGTTSDLLKLWSQKERVAIHGFYLTVEMATTTQLPNGVWVIQWATWSFGTAEASSVQTVQCDHASLELTSAINSSQVTLSLTANPGKSCRRFKLIAIMGLKLLHSNFLKNSVIPLNTNLK
jgi:hypothetical protein